MKTIDDFKKSARENNLHYWPVAKCKICDFSFGYLFDHWNENVEYTLGCECVSIFTYKQSSWKNIFDTYNLEKNENVIKKYNEFWKF